ncbi:hypothetical protein M758_10G017800 [Ceratodon purpureus]|nr:hypothetical protein M758_10G017800 [Ceratodon purpureus]
MVCEEDVEEALSFLRRRLCAASWGQGGNDVALPLLPDVEKICRDLEACLIGTIENGSNNSVLLLGPRGCGKTMVTDRVLAQLQLTFPERVSVVRLHGLLHADDRCALKAISEQLCMEHHLVFSKTAAFDDNLHFLITMLKESALSHKSVIFILEEFDLFAQRPKQRLLYNLLDAMQSTLTQAAVVGLSCRLDADELLEKRVRSRFSNRKLLFLPPSAEVACRLLHDVLMLPTDGSLGDSTFVTLWNENTTKVLEASIQDIICHTISLDPSPHRILDLALRAICNLDQGKGLLTVADFKAANASLYPQFKREALQGLSVLELYLLVCMKRLESKEQETYNFTIVFEEYQHLQETHKTSDHYSREIALRAFEHLLERELVVYADFRGRSDAIEFRPVQLLVDNLELQEGLNINPVCPVILRQWFEHTTFK